MRFAAAGFVIVLLGGALAGCVEPPGPDYGLAFRVDGAREPPQVRDFTREAIRLGGSVGSTADAPGYTLLVRGLTATACASLSQLAYDLALVPRPPVCRAGGTP